MLVEISGSGKTPSIDSTDSLEEWDQIVTAVALESRQNLPLEALLGQMSRPQYILQRSTGHPIMGGNLHF